MKKTPAKRNPPDATRRNVKASLTRDARLALKITDVDQRVSALADSYEKMDRRWVKIHNRVTILERVLSGMRSGKLTESARQRIRKLLNM
jgi:hypothetical protein